MLPWVCTVFGRLMVSIKLHPLNAATGILICAVIVTVFTEFLEHKLELKGRPTDTASYYDAESLVDPYEHHENAWAKTFKGIKSFFIKTYSKIAKKKNK